MEGEMERKWSENGGGNGGKSRLSGERMLIKVRPIISHFFHPGRHVLHKVGRALSILVDMATNAVQGLRPAHVAMWRLHDGSRRWIEQLVRAYSTNGCVEFDVEDCFLNTRREMVMDALSYWLSYQFRRTRQQPDFSISKDSKKADHRGKPCSTHFWEISAETVKAVVDWELRHNSTFAVVDASGDRAVLRQHCGLPIGGHLSAALVELVALWREHTCAWPSLLQGRTTARYRDNVFVTSTLTDDDTIFQRLAVDFSEMLSMPVKLEKVGTHVRCLELRLKFSENPRDCCLPHRCGPSW